MSTTIPATGTTEERTIRHFNRILRGTVPSLKVIEVEESCHVARVLVLTGQGCFRGWVSLSETGSVLFLRVQAPCVVDASTVDIQELQDVQQDAQLSRVYYDDESNLLTVTASTLCLDAASSRRLLVSLIQDTCCVFADRRIQLLIQGNRSRRCTKTKGDQ